MNNIITANSKIVAPSQINAQSDTAAIDSFLEEYIYRENTYATYQCEIKKFKCFLQIINLRLSDIKKEDFNQYIAWLQNPPEQLIGQNNLFKKPYTSAGVKHNIRIINNLMNYLIEADYIYRNPLRLIKKYQKSLEIEGREFDVQSKILDKYEVSLVLKAIKDLSEKTKSQLETKMRTELIVALLYHLGLRISELSSSMWSSFKMVKGKCWYFLIGKGGKPGKIPVNNNLLKNIKDYRHYYGKSIDLELFEDEYILKSPRGGSLSTRQIRAVVKNIFNNAANLADNKQSKNKLLNATPHDFRHLLASNLDSLGASILDTKEILRHSSEKTTEIYRHSQDDRRHDVVQNNKLNIGSTISNAKVGVEFKIIIKCRKGDIFSFRYFLNTLTNNYLKKYQLIDEIEQEAVVLAFQKKSVIMQELVINFVITDAVSIDEKNSLRGLIEQAAHARGLDLQRVDY